MIFSFAKYLYRKASYVRLRKQGVDIGAGVLVSDKVVFEGSAVIEPNSRLIADPQIKIGRNAYINVGCHFLGDITIGNDVLIGPQTVIWGRDHGIVRNQLIREQHHERAPINIGNDVWIGANVTILKGVTIASGAVVGAGSIVVKDVAEYCIVVGNPARVVGHRTYQTTKS